MGEVTSLQIIKTIKGIVKQFYANKFDNLDKMNKFFERHKLTKLHKKLIDNTTTF